MVVSSKCHTLPKSRLLQGPIGNTPGRALSLTNGPRYSWWCIHTNIITIYPPGHLYVWELEVCCSITTVTTVTKAPHISSSWHKTKINNASVQILGPYLCIRSTSINMGISCSLSCSDWLWTHLLKRISMPKKKHEANIHCNSCTQIKRPKKPPNLRFSDPQHLRVTSVFWSIDLDETSPNDHDGKRT